MPELLLPRLVRLLDLPLQRRPCPLLAGGRAHHHPAFPGRRLGRPGPEQRPLLLPAVVGYLQRRACLRGGIRDPAAPAHSRRPATGDVLSAASATLRSKDPGLREV